jgi:hypothetical protein
MMYPAFFTRKMKAKDKEDKKPIIQNHEYLLELNIKSNQLEMSVTKKIKRNGWFFNF